MRKTLITIATAAVAAMSLGAASSAFADDPNVTYGYGYQPGTLYSYSCATHFKAGVPGQYGAWGSFIDGCTVALTCPAEFQRCDVNGYAFIENYTHRNERVTMNSRVRRFDSGGSLYGWSDKSCASQYDRCDADDTSVLAAGQTASVQCNGVRATIAGNSAMADCGVKLTYRPLNRTSQQGRGECTDWALYRRPDLNGVVSGNAQNWTAGARAAGRRVSKTPTQGALMVFQGGVMGALASTGHVAYVESVTATTIVVSEQNMNGVRTPTTRSIARSSVPASGVDFIG